MKKLFWLTSAAIVGVMTTTTGARAAETEVSEVEVRAARDINLDRETQSGSRLGLTPLETPASIEVLSGETIRERGDLLISEAVSRAVGVTSVGSPGDGGGALSARGFSGLGSVMQLYDGMRLYVAAGTITFPFDPWTVDRIEVLRGPASVMYGEGAIGGAINVVPKRASTTMREFDYQAGVGTFNTYRIGLGAGGPLNDAISYRLDASYNQSDNWVDRGDSDSLAISGAIRWQATPSLAFTLSDDYGDQRPMHYFGTPLIDGVLRRETLKLNYNVADSALRYEDNWLKLKSEWSPTAAISLRNDLYRLTSDRYWRNAESYAFNSGSGRMDRFDYIAIRHDLEQVGDRLEATLISDLGASGLTNRFLIGGEINRINFTHINNGFIGGDDVDPFNPSPGSFFNSSTEATPRYRTNTDQFAVFLEDRIELTEKLSLSAGIRWDESDFSRRNLITDAEFGRKFRHVDWRVGAVYEAGPTLSIYAQYATGSDPLGSLVTTSASQIDFDLATAHQYEIGVKQLFADGRGQWTLATYEITKKNLLSSPPGQPGVVEQVGQRSARGVELTFAYAPSSRWSFDGNISALDAKYDTFLSGSTSYSGNTPPDVPETTANLWVSYEIAPAWRARAGLRYVGEAYSDSANQFHRPDYALLDLALDWQVREDTKLTLRASNVTDESYAAASYGDQQWILGRPRSVELMLRGRF